MLVNSLRYRRVAAALALLLPVMLGGCFGSAVRLERTDREALGRMLSDLRQARVVFVGEFHTQRDHHRLQLQVIRELSRQGTPLAIGFEMFDLEKQPLLDEWVQGDVPLREFVARYQQSWSIDWAEYDEIMLFARNHRIPMVALDAPADIVQRVTRFGSAALTAAARSRLPAGVTTAVVPSYREFLSRAFRSHEIPDVMFDNFCAAQGLRNSVMAHRIEGYLAAAPRRTMVVVAGVGHAMRRAVPAGLGDTGLAVRIVIPQVPGLYEELDRDDMDYFVTTGDD